MTSGHLEEPAITALWPNIDTMAARLENASRVVTNLSIRDWILQELAVFDREPPQNYLSGALQLAVLHLLQSGVSNGVDEESFTGALLGSFCQSCRVCAAGMPPMNKSTLTWRRHNKNSGNNIGESATGADFALIIRHKEDFARAAIFQAKNGQSKKGSFKAGHISPEVLELPEEPQYVRLKRHCFSILSASQMPDAAALEATKLYWAHYLIYEPFAAYCSPVSSLTVIEERLEAGDSPGTISYKDYPYLNFVDVLRDGCNQTQEKEPGWLNLSSAGAIAAFVKSAEDLYDLYEAHVNPDMKWAPLIGWTEGLSEQYKTLKIKDGLLLPTKSCPTPEPVPEPAQEPSTTEALLSSTFKMSVNEWQEGRSKPPGPTKHEDKPGTSTSKFTKK